MALWVNTGTIALTNGSANVVGTGTSFPIKWTDKGYALIINKDTIYEIASVTDTTHLTLTTAYTGTTTGSATYAVVPTQSISYSVAEDLTDLLDTFGPLRLGVDGLSGYVATATDAAEDATAQVALAAAQVTLATAEKTAAQTAAANAAASVTSLNALADDVDTVLARTDDLNAAVTTAEGHKNAAATSASSASTSATNAATSATNAANSASSAATNAALVTGAIKFPMPGLIELPQATTYTICLNFPFAGTLNQVDYILGAGTCSVQLKKNTTNVGANGAVTTTLTTVSLSNTAIAAGDKVYLVVTSPSAAANLSYTVTVTRT